jgi:ABC-type phosphate/phosphonate transport system substrate-binding protein
LTFLVAVACAAAGPNGAGQPSSATPLNLGLPPGSPAASAGRGSPIATYLERAMGRPVQVRIEPTYKAMAVDLNAGRIDTAFVSDTGYLAVSRSASVRVIGQAAVPLQSPAILCGAGAGVKPLRDGGDWSSLRGHSMLFGPVGSLGANVWPRYYMGRNGVDAIGDVTNAAVIANERQAVLNVYNGIADCAATSSDSRPAVADVAPDIATRVQAVFTAPAVVPAGPHIARRGLDSGIARRFEKALAGIAADPIAAPLVAAASGGPGARPATDHDYQLLRAAVAAVDPGLVARTP